MAPGDVCPDAPLRNGDEACWLLERLGGRFTLLAVGDVAVPPGTGLPVLPVGPHGLADPDGIAAARYGTGTLYLIRPDQHVAARFAAPTRDAIAAAHMRALGRTRADAPPPLAPRLPDLGLDRLGARADDVYAALVEAHRGLSPEAAATLDARLILLLANLTADPEAVIAAIELAKHEPEA